MRAWSSTLLITVARAPMPTRKKYARVLLYGRCRRRFPHSCRMPLSGGSLPSSADPQDAEPGKR